ncbi:MAG: aminotransferase class V-fold PLP-dependent enzyme [Candidatus Latescibacteria bacterium]|jgi:D-glucosaminate-6-phosphate ammonia-lyase|nr:aminotransferase class V-fold PLP-dependent enzyme [Candidatus Latescibacterota bacterium]MBT5833083.1 aminotransferase class V-fold PLP-dependent enzyme [Candidatus Latescibacterota bacterium]
MANVFELLGVRTIINAAGPVTRLSGAVMDDEVVNAMRDAGQYSVDITELQAVAGQMIAEVTGAEAGYVTSGAAAGLMLATAACVTGLEPGKMNRLPDTTGMKDEVIMPRSHRNFYDHAVRAVGVKLIEVGISDRFSGAGVRDTEAWEIADAITDQTAAIVYVAQGHARPSLQEVTAVAKERGVPVIVDAAGQLPPAAHLKRFIAEGADVVCYSGGKTVGGPQGSGILCGRKDIVSAVALQHLDLDVHFDLWNPPVELIDKDRMPGAPQHGIGRPCKVGKEQVVGLMVALRKFVDEGDDVRHARWAKLMSHLAAEIGTLSLADVDLNLERTVPALRVRLKDDTNGAVDVVKQLMDGDPSIHVNTAEVYEGVLGFNPICLSRDQVPLIAKRLRELLG